MKAELGIPASLRHRMVDHLGVLYGREEAAVLWPRLEALLSAFRQRCPEPAGGPVGGGLTERDAILITYGDQFQEPGVPTLETLNEVLVDTLDRVVSGVHILPFFPYSSDDGFSIIDFAQINAGFGDWDAIERLGDEFRLMFDAVVNHISRQSDWFRRFEAGEPEYGNWFIAIEPGQPLDWVSLVVRPRALPLLTPVRRGEAEMLVWTTFSDDQIDLNYAHPDVLLKMVEILLIYVEKGAQLIRLDAIAYLWKTIGTSCIHLEETHRVVKLFRCVLDAVAPGTLLITETNVPHEDNIAYFGQPLPGPAGTDEAQMVYQFPLAPLIMHSLLTGDAQVIASWAAGLEAPSPQATFFNFTASHDGIGLMPARGLLTESQIQALAEATLAHGGRVSHKTNSDGSRSVYELNISYFDALSDPNANEPLSLQVQRFMVSQAIMLALRGVPGIYVHSLLGSRSWLEGVVQTGRNRTINRQKFDRQTLEAELKDPTSLRCQVLTTYRRLLEARSADLAFHPYGTQQVLFLEDGIFSLIRTSPDGRSQVLCLHNVTAEECQVRINTESVGVEPGAWRDLLTGEDFWVGREATTLQMAAYGVRWLRIRS